MKEFDPRSDKRDPHQVGAWLIKSGAVLGLAAGCNLIANKLVVHDFNNGGSWHVPLRHAVHFVDDVDSEEGIRHPATLWITGMTDDKPADVQVWHTGANDEPQTVRVDLESPITLVLND